MERPILSQTIEDRQRACDHVSFFVDDHVYEELSPMQIAKHNCLHLLTVVEKLSMFLEDPSDAEGQRTKETVLRQEVVPDLVVYALQIATAFRIDWLMMYAEVDTHELANVLRKVDSLKELVELRSQEQGGRPEARQVLQSARRAIIKASAYLARLCDKDDHGTPLPTDEIGRNVTSVLLREGLDMAAALQVDLDETYDRRIEDIKRKYGNVRVLLGRE